MGRHDETGLRPPAATGEQLLCEIAYQLAQINESLRHMAHREEPLDPSCELCRRMLIQEATEREEARAEYSRSNGIAGDPV